MPIFDLNFVLPYLFAIVFFIGIGCFAMLFLVVFSILVLIGFETSFQIRFGKMISLARSGVGRGELGDAGFASQENQAVQTNPIVPHFSVEGGILPTHSTDTIINHRNGQKSGADLKRELDLIDQQFRLNNKKPADVYPANKITVKCGGCYQFVRAGEGYMHYNIGVRKTFCLECHRLQGLPIREEHANMPIEMGEDIKMEV